jgi:hypothetical protein
LSAGKLQEKEGGRDAAALAEVHADLTRGYESAATPEQKLEVANELARQYDALGLGDEATDVRVEVLQKVLPRGGSLKEEQLKGVELEPILRVPVLEKVKQKARELPGYPGGG